MVYIFADLDRLGRELRESGTLSDGNLLLQFNHGLAQSQPLVLFQDCGMGKGAVEAKMQSTLACPLVFCHVY